MMACLPASPALSTLELLARRVVPVPFNGSMVVEGTVCPTTTSSPDVEVRGTLVAGLKKKTLTSLVNYSTLLSSTGITFQNKEKYSTQYNYSTIQLEYFFLTNFTMTRVCKHTSWLPEKPATARSARGRDKVQTCYFH